MSRLSETPKTVRYTVIALYAQLVLGLLYFLITYDSVLADIAKTNPDFSQEKVRQLGQSLVLAHCFNTLIYSVVYYLILLRKNWARIVFLVLTIAGLPFVYKVIPHAIANPLAGVIYLLTIGISIGSVYMLFFTPAKEWFLAKAKDTDEVEAVKTPDHLLK